MRNVFYLLAALLAFGVAGYFWQDVTERTATVTKLRLVAGDDLVIEAGTVVDAAFLDEMVVSQPIPRALAGDFAWAMNDTPEIRINMLGTVVGRDVAGGSFLQRAQFFVPQEDDFARRIRVGNRAISVPVENERVVENFVVPGARVDVIGAFKTSAGIAPRRLLENVEVMAVDGIDGRGELAERGGSYNSVTLQAPAAGVEALVAAMEDMEGALSLVLRNPCEDPADCAPEVAQR